MADSFTLHLVRHAESLNNALPESQRVSDPALTELGLLQAEKLGSRLQQEATHKAPPDRILVSPFLRTLQTIAPAAERLSILPLIRSQLYEAGGCYEGYEPGRTTGKPGMSSTEIAERFPGFIIPDDIDNSGWYKLDDFEPWHAANERAKYLSEQLLEEFHGKDISVICLIHGDLIRLLLSHFCKGDPMLSDTHVANTSLTSLRFGHDGKMPEVLLHNNTDHLAPHEVSF